MRAMTLRLPDDIYEALRREKYETRRSMQDIVEGAIRARYTTPKRYDSDFGADAQTAEERRVLSEKWAREHPGEDSSKSRLAQDEE